jgi:hypothetical protein
MTHNPDVPHVGSIVYSPDYGAPKRPYDHGEPDQGVQGLSPEAYDAVRLDTIKATLPVHQFRVEQPRFKFKPQLDITPYELALVVEELSLFCDQATLDKLSERTWTDFKRHFEPARPKR